MNYLIKTFLSTVSICTLFWLPMHKAVSETQSDAPKSMPSNWAEINAKIATLALEQQKTASMINALQTSLNALHAKRKAEVMQVVVQRTANGHGR